MYEGQKVAIVRDNERPEHSANTDLVAAWLTLGGQLTKSGSFQHAMDGDSRFVQWLVEDNIKCVVDGEEIEWSIFKNRFLDIEWCQAHPESQITAIRAFRDNRRDLVAFAKRIGVGVLKRDNRGHGIVYPDSPEWLKQEFSNRFLK